MGDTVTYALVFNNTIQATGSLPNSARRLDTQEWVLGIPTASVDLQQATGWFLVVNTSRPVDTATDTYVRTVELIATVPTVVWTQRPWTVDELAGRQTVTNRTSIETNLAADMVKIQAILDTANATLNTAPAPAIKDMARMLRRLGRFAINDLNGTT